MAVLSFKTQRYEWTPYGGSLGYAWLIGEGFQGGNLP